MNISQFRFFYICFELFINNYVFYGTVSIISNFIVNDQILLSECRMMDHICIPNKTSFHILSNYSMIHKYILLVITKINILIQNSFVVDVFINFNMNYMKTNRILCISLF